MNARKSILVLVIVSVSTAAFAGEHPSSVVLRERAPDVKLSGNARIDFSAMAEFPAIFQGGSPDASSASRKSPWLAAGFSMVIPGAGEFYAESYLKSALFFAAEVGLWVLAYTYDHKGDKQTDYFQNYANANWNVVSYGTYAEQHLHPPHGPYNWLIPNTEAYASTPWLRVNWAELNRMESDLGGTAAASYYSHVLPAYNTQQYYELIGKYPQFNQGWSDAPPSFNYGDPLSSESLYYDGERGKANNYYTTASTFVAIIIVNHIVSAVDAALTAGSYNRGLHASVGSQCIPVYGGYATVPVLRLTWGL